MPSRHTEGFMNRLKALLLLATLTGLVVWVGQLVGGTGGMVAALAFAAAMNLGAWWWSDRLVLRVYGAHEVSEASAPELYGIVRALAQRARTPMPRVYLLPEDAPNPSPPGAARSARRSR
jgi:heat shock protein HtpX